MPDTITPLMPTDAEIDAADKSALVAIVESHGLPVPAKATAAELRPWARAVVHGARGAYHDEPGTGTGGTPPETPHEEPPAVTEAPPDAGPAVDVDAAQHPEPGVALEPAPTHVIPEVSRFQQIQQIAEYLFKSSLRPKGLKNVEDVGLVLLAANDLGIPLTMAMQKIPVVNGRLSMMGELMSALILRDGHSIKPDPDNDARYAKVWGRRKGTDEWVWAEFTIEDAYGAGLVTYDQDGNIRARSDDGKKLPWELYTADMLYWRAFARLARRNFGDCLGGVSYTPDELGYIEVDDVEQKRPGFGRSGEDEPTMTHKQMIREIARRIEELPDDLKAELREEWKRRNFPRPDDLRAAQIGTAHRMLDAVEAKAAERDDTSGIPEADTVDETAGEGTPDPEVGEGPAGDGGQDDHEGDGSPAAAKGAAVDGDLSAAPDAGTFDPEANVLMCAAGDGAIPDDEPPVWGDDDRPYHQSCSPFA